MELLKNFSSADTHIEDDTLKGHVLDRLLIFAAGCEQRTLPNVDSYDAETGRVNFTYPLGNIMCTVLIVD